MNPFPVSESRDADVIEDKSGQDPGPAISQATRACRSDRSLSSTPQLFV
jgi:hypothetical protein